MTNQTKVKLPREVAEAIEKIRQEECVTNFDIVNCAYNAISDEDLLVIKDWAFNVGGEGNPDLLMSALVNGYEVEKSPEERVREYYDFHVRKIYETYGNDYVRHLTRVVAIKETLNLLGITIEGINDKEKRYYDEYFRL